MKRTELINVPLSAMVKLTPQGKVYTVVMSAKDKFSPALRDNTGRIKELSRFTSVYVLGRII
jgi:hypothetical protein